MSDVARVASWLRGARAVVVITGAGTSAESGVPTFRGADGLWRSFRPEDLATPQAFARDTELVWNWDSRFPDYLLLTQNVDGLHTRAGSRRLVEVHGNIWRARCTKNPSHVLDESGKGVGSLFAERYAEKTPDPFPPFPHVPCVARCFVPTWCGSGKPWSRSTSNPRRFRKLPMSCFVDHLAPCCPRSRLLCEGNCPARSTTREAGTVSVPLDLGTTSSWPSCLAMGRDRPMP